jgi:hypothetical protein
MAAMDDLTELVERAAVAEKTALSSIWKEGSDVQGLIRSTRKAAAEQRQAVSRTSIRSGSPRVGRVCGRTTSTSTSAPSTRCPARSRRRRRARQRGR